MDIGQLLWPIVSQVWYLVFLTLFIALIKFVWFKAVASRVQVNLSRAFLHSTNSYPSEGLPIAIPCFQTAGSSYDKGQHQNYE